MQQDLSKQRLGSVAVNDNDRLGFTIVMALALHALIIFGLGFDSLIPDASSKLLEVTLTQFKNDEAPKKSDFIAQYNQEGSGTIKESAQLTSDYKNIYQDNIVRKIQLNAPSVIKTDPFKQQQVINTAISEQDIYAQDNKELRDLQYLSKSTKEQLEQQNLEIASLEAKLNQQKQLFAKAPKIRVITSVSAKASNDAAYINSFREKIEYIGNKYYPHEAKAKNYHGDVQLLVSLKQDGHIHSIEMLRSSNNPVLDKAAINSVRLAAPFPRFPKHMREHTDILEIIRTWQFRSQSLSTRS
jgi:periplasmic protein TonB